MGKIICIILLHIYFYITITALHSKKHTIFDSSTKKATKTKRNDNTDLVHGYHKAESNLMQCSGDHFCYTFANRNQAFDKLHLSYLGSNSNIQPKATNSANVKKSHEIEKANNPSIYPAILLSPFPSSLPKLSSFESNQNNLFIISFLTSATQFSFLAIITGSLYPHHSL